LNTAAFISFPPFFDYFLTAETAEHAEKNLFLIGQPNQKKAKSKFAGQGLFAFCQYVPSAFSALSAVNIL
jgi:hypothetical protein